MTVDNGADIIDSRDVIARIEQLQALRTAGPVPDGVLDVEDEDTDQDDLFHEMATLEALAAEASNYAGDWEYGAALIRYSHFKDYAMDLAEEIGALPAEYSWPASCIDWEQAARELRMDYTSVDFDGITYWVR